MRGIILITLPLLVFYTLFGTPAQSQDFGDARTKCTQFGFKENTKDHDECVRQFLKSTGSAASEKQSPSVTPLDVEEKTQKKLVLKPESDNQQKRLEAEKIEQGKRQKELQALKAAQDRLQKEIEAERIEEEKKRRAIEIARAEQDKRQKEIGAEKIEQEKQRRAIEIIRENQEKRQKASELLLKLATLEGTDYRNATPSADYASKVSAEIGANILLFKEVSPNLIAEYLVQTGATGNILTAKLTKSSGDAYWDDVALRAISKTGRLPPDKDGRVPSLMTITLLSPKKIANETLYGSVGVMDFKFIASPGWKIENSPETNARVISLLQLDGANFKPNFVFANEKTGALLFGFWYEVSKGTVINAAQLAADMPSFPKDWSIDLSQFFSGVRTSAKGLDYALMRIVGQGDGNAFARPNKSVKTLAIWVDIPFQYEFSGKAFTGAFAIYYRGPDFNDRKAYETIFDNQQGAGDILIRDLIDSLTLKSNAIPITANEYKVRHTK